MTAESSLGHISDTAYWVAIYRAREGERPDALFRDPLAKRLAGERGDELAQSMQFSEKHAWSFVMRTHLLDRLIDQQVQQGVDCVINLAAGLDTRPYRMTLPPTLKWIEVDLPALLAYKQTVLADEKPACDLQRVELDVLDVQLRRTCFAQWADNAKKVMVICEGLLAYMADDQVAALADDLAAAPSFARWALDLASPALLRMVKKKTGGLLSQGAAELKFAPENGPDFFAAHGWNLLESHSFLKTAARYKRVGLLMRLLASTQSHDAPRNGSIIWGGVCLFARAKTD